MWIFVSYLKKNLKKTRILFVYIENSSQFRENTGDQLLEPIKKTYSELIRDGIPCYNGLLAMNDNYVKSRKWQLRHLARVDERFCCTQTLTCFEANFHQWHRVYKERCAWVAYGYSSCLGLCCLSLVWCHLGFIWTWNSWRVPCSTRRSYLTTCQRLP